MNHDSLHNNIILESKSKQKLTEISVETSKELRKSV